MANNNWTILSERVFFQVERVILIIERNTKLAREFFKSAGSQSVRYGGYNDAQHGVLALL